MDTERLFVAESNLNLAAVKFAVEIYENLVDFASLCYSSSISASFLFL